MRSIHPQLKSSSIASYPAIVNSEANTAVAQCFYLYIERRHEMRFAGCIATQFIPDRGIHQHE
jgi:hypothetical protein